ncbi:hypothetical protein [Halomonas sp. BMC6]|uniref:hypothetical protein n=1 Tax=Halomonas sp. BMC6 TaxID=3073244 RepID=UPI0030D1008B
MSYEAWRISFQNSEQAARAAYDQLQAALSRAGVWLPIEQANKDSQAMLLYSEEFICLDFNPEGVIEGYWQDDEGWIGAVWNGCHDQWTAQPVQPTHFMPKPTFKVTP